MIKDLDYTYDAASNRKSVRPANSRTYNYSYDQSSRMTLVEDGSRDLAKYTYDQIGRRTSLVLSYRSASANTVTYNYEPDGALDSLIHAFDNSNNDVDYSFDYTLANQVSFRTVDNQTFQFAPVAKEETYTANGLNQYTQIMKDQVLIGLTYDANGNLTGDGTWTYTYDVENRLTNATDGVTDVDYVYGPLGRRVKKSGVGVTARLYLSDGTEEVLEMTTSGSIQARYVYGPGVDEPIMTWQTSSTSLGNMRFYRADPQGSIIALTDRDGEVEDTYTYDAYGNPDDPSGQPIRYTGRRWDPETGLYYYRARMYNPSLGRFLQTDPIGYEDQMNIYAYVGNDPINAIDPTGKDTTTCTQEGDKFRCTVIRNDEPDTLIFETDEGTTTFIYAEDRDLTLEDWAEEIGAGRDYIGSDLGGTVNEYWLTEDERNASWFGAAVLLWIYDNIRGGKSKPGGGMKPPSTRKGDAFHRAAPWKRNQALRGKPERFRGGDGKMYDKYTVRGEVNGKSGTFEYYVDEAGDLTHQFFRPDK